MKHDQDKQEETFQLLSQSYFPGGNQNNDAFQIGKLLFCGSGSFRNKTKA